MKKLIIMIAFLLCAANSAFAASGTVASAGMDLTQTGLSAYGGAASPATTLIGKTSTGVALGWITSANGYALVTQHKSGSRGFGTSWDSTSIYYLNATAAGVLVLSGAPTASNSSQFASWQSM